MNKELYQINKYHSIEVVSTVEEFVKLKDTWDCLAEKCESYTPWLSFDWFNLCLKYSLDMNRLLILLVYREHNVVAIAPFFVQDAKYKGILKTRKIELIGNAQSPIRNFLFGDADDKEKDNIISSILSFFCRVYKDWDLIELDTLPEEQNAFDAVQRAIVYAGLEYRSYFCTGNWYLDKITYPSTEYFNRQPHPFRKQIENKKKRLNKLDNWRVEINSYSASLDNHLDLYDQLRAISWKSPEKDKQFNRDFAKLAAKKRWLRLSILFSGDIPIASQKWIVSNKTAYIWSLVYDFGYKKYSPGAILSSEICKCVIDRDRVVEIDYMKGDEPYKKYWTPKRRERKGVTIFNHSYRGRFLAFLMATVLPTIEKNKYWISMKNSILAYLKQHC